MQISEAVLLTGLINVATVGAAIILNQGLKIAELTKSLEEKSEENLSLLKEMSSLSEQPKKAERSQIIFLYLSSRK